jgi:glycogen debranching enzyme
MQACQEYCQLAPEGTALLDAKVYRRFNGDEFSEPLDEPQKSCLLRDCLLEVMERHARGIDFIEWNAGTQLDHAMRPEGFHMRIWVDRKTGLLYGGNRWNCGTWMDKMGDSHKAGTAGVPSTPRDGAAVEINGLLKSTLRWLIELSAKGQFPSEVTLEGNFNFFALFFNYFLI